MLYSTPYPIVKKKMREPVEILKRSRFDALYRVFSAEQDSRGMGDSETRIKEVNAQDIDRV
jgi:hypothetical protein